MGSYGLVVAQVSTLPYLIHPHLSLCITVMMLVLWELSGCFQGCLGPFGLGSCLSRGGFTRICRSAVILVLVRFHTVPTNFPITSDGGVLAASHKTLFLSFLCFGTWNSYFFIILSLSSHSSLDLVPPLCTPVSTSDLQLTIFYLAKA